jgi:hypothetical protein
LSTHTPQEFGPIAAIADGLPIGVFVLRDRARGPGAPLRAVLHDEAGRRRNPEHDVEVSLQARAAAERVRAGEQFDIIVFITGGAFTPAANAFVARMSNPLLQKPFDRKALEAVLASRLGALDAPGCAESTAGARECATARSSA